eukprot:8643245-Prorocentrum_lima.AAC.1
MLKCFAFISRVGTPGRQLATQVRAEPLSQIVLSGRNPGIACPSAPPNTRTCCAPSQEPTAPPSS